MEDKRVSSEGAGPSKRALGALGLFGLVPLAAVLAFLTVDDGQKSAPRLTEVAQNDQLRESDLERGGPPPRAPKPELERTQAQETDVSPWPSPNSDRSSLPPPESSADEDASRLMRFDDNARAFDERLAAFDREQGQIDENASEKAQAALQASLQEIHPEVRVTARCTASVCVVEVTSPDPIGAMIARIAPWLRKNTRAATGDPVDAEDENSLRLAFEKGHAPGNF